MYRVHARAIQKWKKFKKKRKRRRRRRGKFEETEEDVEESWRGSEEFIFLQATNAEDVCCLNTNAPLKTRTREFYFKTRFNVSRTCTLVDRQQIPDFQRL